MENIVSILDHVPVGFRFRPTDEELVNYYLKHKLLGDDFSVQVIPEIDLCRVEPWDVPGNANTKHYHTFHHDAIKPITLLFDSFLVSISYASKISDKIR